MRTGRMDRLITLKKRSSSSQDTYGTEINIWTDMVVWAERWELKGNERFIAQQQLATLSARYFIYYREDLTTQDLLVDGDHTFNIQAILSIGRRKGLELLVATLENV